MTLDVKATRPRRKAPPQKDHVAENVEFAIELFAAVTGKGSEDFCNLPHSIQAKWVRAASLSKQKPLTNRQIFQSLPGGVLDCLSDPWDENYGDGDIMRSIKNDVLRIVRAIEERHGIK